MDIEPFEIELHFYPSGQPYVDRYRVDDTGRYLVETIEIDMATARMIERITADDECEDKE